MSNIRPPGPEPSADEMKALREVRLGRVIDESMRGRLVAAGLIKQGLGGWMLTDIGKFWDGAKP